MRKQQDRAIAAAASVVIIAGALIAQPGTASAYSEEGCADFYVCDVVCPEGDRTLCRDTAVWFQDCESTGNMWTIGECDAEQLACEFQGENPQEGYWQARFCNYQGMDD